jgi:hypothetical protein
MTVDSRFFGVPIEGYRIAIDSPERYRQAIRDMRAGKVRVETSNAQEPS